MQDVIFVLQLQETINWFGDHFTAQRKNNTSLYSSYANYVVKLAEFTKFLIKALCARLSSIVDVHSMTVDEGTEQLQYNSVLLMRLLSSNCSVLGVTAKIVSQIYC